MTNFKISSLLYMPKNKTWDNWTKNDEARYSALYTYVKDKVKNNDNFTYIEDNKRGLMTFIEKNPKWKNTTKEAILFMVAKYLKLSDYLKYGRLYSAKGYEYMMKNREKENENQQDDHEKEIYRSHEFLLNVIDNIKPEQIATKKGNIQFLLLNMLVLQPPLRPDFYLTAKFIFLKKDNDNINNFIWISKRGKLKINYIVNNDKVSKTKVYNMNKNLNIINIENDNLSNLINESYNKYPRKYLLEIDDKPITHATFLDWLRKITDVKGITNDIMRSSYINWFYDNNSTMSSRERLSHQMRHSVLTAQKNYIKVIEEADTNLIDNLKLEYEILSNKLSNCESENKITDAQLKKRRRDIVYKINVKGVEPKESTLIKYSITYDNITKKYK